MEEQKTENFQCSTHIPDQKQLKDDFQVLQYLRINKHKEQNSDNYLKFLNEILFSKKKKQDTLRLMARQSTDSEQTLAQKRDDDKEIESLNIRYHHEIGVRGDLEREAEECWKSIRLFRGDIGHIVERNESEKMLSSKINKGNIIALDQYHKVSKQLTKEKQEAKELRGMRDVFIQKLRNACRIQKNGLVKTEQAFFDLLRKHKEVQLKLNEIERNGSLIEEYSQMKRKTLEKKSVVVLGMEIVFELLNLLRSENSQYIIRHFDSSDPDTLRSKSMEISKLRESIQETLTTSCKLIYPNTTYAELETSIDEILQTYNMLACNVSSLSTTYNEGLKRLQSLKEEHLQLLGKENINDGDSIEDQLTGKNFEQQTLQDNVMGYIRCLFTFASFFSTPIPKPNIKRLINQLIIYLSKQKHEMTDDSLFQNWDHKFERVMREVRSIDIEDTTKGDFQKMPKAYTSKYLLNKTVNVTIQTLLFGDVPPIKQLNSESSRRQSTPEQKQLQEIYLDSSGIFEKQRNRTTHHSLTNKSTVDSSTTASNKAKRIRFLQRIDQDYYKMLKKTLQLQKEYTRDNHKFTRTFKRDKYVKRDNISREKQFQSTFSVLWSHKQGNSSALQKTKSAKSLHSAEGMNAFKSIPLNRSIKMKLNSLFDKG